MGRVNFVACVLLVATMGAFAAAPPPLWRNLTKEEEKQVAGLDARAVRHGDKEEFEKTLELVKEIASFRAKRQGASHWQAIDAQVAVEEWQRLVKVAKADRSAILRAWASNRAGVDLFVKGRPQEADKLLRAALSIFEKALGEEHPLTAAACGNLAACMEAEGRHDEALPLRRRDLAICEKAQGVVHRNTAAGYSNLAACLEGQGRYGEALPLHRLALAIRQKALGECHPNTSTSYKSLAYCLDLQGNYDEALPLFRRALAILLNISREGNSQIASSYAQLALCLDHQGRHAEAMPLHRRALAINEKVLGTGHPLTAACGNCLALCLNSQGKHAEALPLYRQSLVTFENRLGSEHPRTVASLNNLAACLDSLGRQKEALPLYRRVLMIREKAGSNKNTNLATNCNNAAYCLSSQGNHAEALPLFRRALAINETTLGVKHPRTAGSYHNLAFCLGRQGKYAEALPLLRLALNIDKEALGEEHPDTAICYNHLAGGLNSLGKHAEALHLLQASLPGQEAARYHTASSGFDRAFASSDKDSPHAILAVGLARLEQPRNAFRHAEFALARGLLDDLAGSAPDDLRRIAALGADIDSLNASILPLTTKPELSDAEESRRNTLVRRRRLLEGVRSQLASAISARQVLPLERIQRQIPADAALVLWVGGFDHRMACVLRRDGLPSWVKLHGSGKDGTWTKDDIAVAGRAYASLTDPFLKDDARKSLYKQCLAPLESHLKGVKRLLVVPTGPMAMVPVEALTDRWLVSYVPSGSAFARSAERAAAKRSTSALVLADPVFTTAPPVYPKAPPHGLLVTAVVGGSLAQRIGLRPGDVLLEYAEKTLKTPTDLIATKGDERIAIKLWREGKAMGGRIPAGDLGAVVDKRPVADALAAWRVKESKLLASRGGKEWDALPGTRLEALSLAKLLPGATTLLGSEASEQNLDRLATEGKLKDIGILHLATHGEANTTRPRETALILSQDRLPTPKEQEKRVLDGKRPVEGRLTVGTVLDGWKLDAELVTLSACQTGLGADAGGEGMLGFAQALLQKGTRSVLLSRWKVDDGATSLLMVRFYENLLGDATKKPMPKAEALRDAKAWLRDLPREEALKRLATLFDGVPRGERSKIRPALPERKTGPKADRPYAHPYYWAAFVLIGDPR